MASTLLLRTQSSKKLLCLEKYFLLYGGLNKFLICRLFKIKDDF